ncbi:MAG: DUF6326 family protein [Trueperaceae bacterium]|nr:DUF6326 family protein [Trueperaceae bacterium]
MTRSETLRAALENVALPVQTKLAAAWASFMFLYVYVDLLGFFKPGIVEDILAGVVFEFDISQTFLVIALTSVTIPLLMILLSMTLPARANRTLNLVVASLYVPYSAFNLAGGEWLYYYGLGLAVELIVLAVILRLAWTWPRGVAAKPERPSDRAAQLR